MVREDVVLVDLSLVPEDMVDLVGSVMETKFSELLLEYFDTDDSACSNFNLFVIKSNLVG